MNIKIVPPSRNYITDIAKNLRKSDAMEVQAASGIAPLEAIESSIERSYESGVILKDEVPQLVYGICLEDDEGTSAVPWMLSKDTINEWRREFLNLSCSFIRNWSSYYRNIYNYVDARNTVSIRWLKWMGFDQTHVIHQFGFEGRPFVCMERCAIH